MRWHVSRLAPGIYVTSHPPIPSRPRLDQGLPPERRLDTMRVIRTRAVLMIVLSGLLGVGSVFLPPWIVLGWWSVSPLCTALGFLDKWAA
jgi:hypothetical protein